MLLIGQTLKNNVMFRVYVASYAVYIKENPQFREVAISLHWPIPLHSIIRHASCLGPVIIQYKYFHVMFLPYKPESEDELWLARLSFDYYFHLKQSKRLSVLDCDIPATTLRKKY